MRNVLERIKRLVMRRTGRNKKGRGSTRAASGDEALLRGTQRVATSEDCGRWGRRKGGGIFGNRGIGRWIGDTCRANKRVPLPGECHFDIVVASICGVGSWKLENIATSDEIDGALEVVGHLSGRGEEDQASGELTDLVERVFGTQQEMKAEGMDNGRGLGRGI